jgi:hypothetical protein
MEPKLAEAIITSSAALVARGGSALGSYILSPESVFFLVYVSRYKNDN